MVLNICQGYACSLHLIQTLRKNVDINATIRIAFGYVTWYPRPFNFV